jgi:hypothetical protein
MFAPSGLFYCALVTMPSRELDLTPLERRLVEHVTRGELLDLEPDEGRPATADALTWDDDRALRADVLREVLRGRLAPDADPRGIRVRGARIEGRLDLDHLTCALPLSMRDCLLPQGLTAREAQLSVLDLAGSRLDQATEPCLDAARLTLRGSLLLAGTVVSTQADAGAIVLDGAQIGGDVDAAGAVVRNLSGPALTADNLRVGQSLSLTGGFTAEGTGGRGAVRFVGARVNGILSCSSARITNLSGPAVVARGVRVEQSVYLDDGFAATGNGTSPTVHLRQASIGEALHCEGAVLHNARGPALGAEDMRVGKDVFLSGVSATAHGGWATVQLLSARIDGNLLAHGARLRNDSASALDAESMRVGEDVFLSKGFDAVGGGERKATLDLASVHVGGVFVFDPAILEHLTDGHWRLGADGLTYRAFPDSARGTTG